MQPLEIRDLKKDFGNVAALRGVDFSVLPGEIFGYLGPNGAGKTTTLRIVLGLVRASRGHVALFGRSPLDPRSRSDVGFLPGDLRLYPDMTALGVLDFFARFRPERPAVLRDTLIEALALERATLSRRIKFLSHGTRQKVGLIAAMQHDPALLLLDEPSTGLDPLVQHAFRSVLREYAARGRSVLFSTHVLSEAEALCKRVAILREGSIVALETVENLRSQVVRRLRVRFRGRVPDLNVPGVSRQEANLNDVVLWVRGDINPVLRVLAASEVEEVVFPEPELEDIFLSYYA
ncbi:MAG TPA: ABC transporter ATP-binding protein [Longimicrobiales bacterium]